MNDALEKAAALRAQGQAFALATVVGRRAPVSAHLGDRAIVYTDGRMDGFVGGACSREIVRKHALQALKTRHSLLVSIRPDASAGESPDPEHVIVPMTCASEGAIDVYVEPFMPARRLIVVGATPVAEALARVAVTVDYQVVRIVDARDRRDLHSHTAEGIDLRSLESLGEAIVERSGDVAVVVASQGHYDEEALEAALKANASYVGLVASRKRGANVQSFLQGSGVPHVDSIRCPAGLDLGARSAPEVALSILAEIVQLQPAASINAAHGSSSDAPVGSAHHASHAAPAAAADSLEPRRVSDASRAAALGGGAPSALKMPTGGFESPLASTAVDPVCQMDVEMADARYTAEVAGTTYYFCCAQCRTRFVATPDAFLSAS
jgi:xanthine dehydrogenase accessory factor